LDACQQKHHGHGLEFGVVKSKDMAIFASDANTDEPTRMLVVLSPGQLKPSAGGKHVEAI